MSVTIQHPFLSGTVTTHDDDDYDDDDERQP